MFSTRFFQNLSLGLGWRQEYWGDFQLTMQKEFSGSILHVLDANRVGVLFFQELSSGVVNDIEI